MNYDDTIEKYALDKIVYDGTKAQFIKLMEGESNAYGLLGTLTDKIICSDGEIGAKTSPAKERLEYVY